MRNKNEEYWLFFYAWNHSKATTGLIGGILAAFITFCFGGWRMYIGLTAIVGVLMLAGFAQLLYLCLSRRIGDTLEEIRTMTNELRQYTRDSLCGYITCKQRGIIPKFCISAMGDQYSVVYEITDEYKKRQLSDQERDNMLKVKKEDGTPAKVQAYDNNIVNAIPDV